MIGQASSHGWDHGLPLLGRSVVVFGWERVWEALSSTAMWDNETVVRQLHVLITIYTITRYRDTTKIRDKTQNDTTIRLKARIG